MRDLTLYQSFRPEIIRYGTGGLLLWSRDTLLGAGIKVLGPEQSKALPEKVNHASVIVILQGVASGEVRVYNYEALEDGFRPHFLGNELESYEGTVFWCPLKPEYDRASVECQCVKYEGTPYDYRALFGMALRRPEIDTSRMICSEAAEVVVSGRTSGPVHAPGELPDLGYWGMPIKIL